MLALASAVQLDLSMHCEDAFNEFIARFDKHYRADEVQQAHDNFCENYDRLVSLVKNGSCTDCGLTGIMDRRLDELRRPGILKVQKKMVVGDIQKLKGVDCQTYICAMELNMDRNTKYYSSIDFRENGLQVPAKDQGGCGSCWAFGVTAVLESLILTDQRNGLPNAHPAWAFNSNNLSLSEQFILSNSWGFQEYCKGGNFITAIDYINQNFKTVELASNIPNNVIAYEEKWDQRTPIPPVLQQSDYYIPFQSFDAGNPEYPRIATIYIYDHNSVPVGRVPVKRNQIKQLLSYGVAVSATVYASPSLSYYQGNKVVHEDCPGRDKVDHQVTVTGYGKKDGKDVWVIRNSWGAGWGSNGYMYLEQGRNSFCSELYFYTVLPRYFKGDKPADVGTKMRGGPKQLDDDDQRLVDPDFTPSQASSQAVLIVVGVAGAVVSLLAVALLIAYFVRKGRKAQAAIHEELE